MSHSIKATAKDEPLYPRPQGQYCTAPSSETQPSPTPIPLSDSQARLAAYEAMTRALQQEYQDLTQRLESLRAHNKTRSAQFRELLGQKLILSAQLARLKAWGLL